MVSLPVELVEVSCDVVVVGGGGAASRAALSARQAGARVRLVTKAAFKSGGSSVHGASEIMSMGAAGFGDRADSAQLHYDDTMRAGRGFIDPALVRVLAEDAPARIRDLILLGVAFDEEREGYKLIRSDFGSHARALGVRGKTGKAFVDALSDELLQLGVDIDAEVALIDLVRDGEGAAAGVLGYDMRRRVLIHYRAPSVVLGTGGIHSAFEQQVSTAEMTGDGQAICFRHGAELVNLEFHQLGPALVHPYVQLFSGSCFRLYPRLINAEGAAFLANYLPPGVAIDAVYDAKGFPFTSSNLSRYIDISMAHEVSAGRGTARGAVYFSFEHVPPSQLEASLPNTTRWLRERGVDPRREKLEVGVAFQCLNGGVRMLGPDAQSTIPGLYVIGELAGGVRGPDRPGGNSLAEGQVFGHRAGTTAAQRARGRNPGAAQTLAASLEFLSAVCARKGPGAAYAEMANAIRCAMQRNCLVEKTASGLHAALATVSEASRELEFGLALNPDTLVDGLSVRNLAQTSELVLRACLNRKETRSAHYRLDYPDRDDAAYLRSFVLRKDGDGIAFAAMAY